MYLNIFEDIVLVGVVLLLTVICIKIINPLYKDVKYLKKKVYPFMLRQGKLIEDINKEIKRKKKSKPKS